MNDPKQMNEHEEIELLLPWYVNATLEPAEHDRVAIHVSSCVACQESVSLLTEVQATVARNKATPIVPQPRVNDLLNSIESRKPLVRPGKQQVASYMMAAAVTLALVATLIVSNPDDPAGIPAEFETATSSPSVISMDYVLRIQFTPDTSETVRNRLLQDMGARDISGGIAEGAYRVIVQLSAASLEDLNRYTESLQSLPEVASVDVIALQLPMKTEQ